VTKKNYTQTPWGFLLVGAAFSSCLGEPIIFRVLPGFWAPIKIKLFEIHLI